MADAVLNFAGHCAVGFLAGLFMLACVAFLADVFGAVKW